MQESLWAAMAAAIALVAVAAIMEWRRNRRRNLDAPGWVPWRGLQVAFFFFAIGFAILAMRAG